MPNHLEPEELLATLDGELPAGDRHVLLCAECRGKCDSIEAGLQDYRDYRRDVLMALAPPPPAAWRDLEAAFDAIDRRRSTPRLVAAPRRRWLPWTVAAAAAALLIGYAGYRRIPSVQAAALLQRAAGNPAPMPPDTPLRVHTRARDFIRPAVLYRVVPGQGGDLPRLFAAAQFDWEQPFSARAFAQWRRRLRDKRDHVEIGDSVCLIRTSSASNPLATATLELRAADLAPLREKLEFREETVEISAAGAAAAAATPPPSAPLHPPAAPSADLLPVAARALHVLAALHSIGADLGELELRETGPRLLVEGTGVDNHRREEIRRALDGIAGVDVTFADDSGAATAPEPHRQNQNPAGAAPLRTLLESKLGQDQSIEDVVNRILDTSDAMMARAFALRSLARRYPPETELSLPPSDRDLLIRLREDYAHELGTRFDRLAGMLASLVSPTPPAPAAPSSWQQQAEQTFASLQSLDALLSATLAGPPRGSPPRDELLRQLQDALTRSQAAVGALP